MAYSQAKNKVPYSTRERRMLTIIPKRGRINSTDLVERYWKGREPPFNSRVAAMDALRSLKGKVKTNKETFTIETSERAGPRPVDVWIEKKR